MSRFVLDNTVTMAWCFRDEATDLSRALLVRVSNLTDYAVVPTLWLYEVVNVTQLAARKGRITEREAKEFLSSLTILPIAIETPTRSQIFDSVRALTAQFRLTAYDAAYLELAIRENLPLATFDNALAQAARTAGVPVMQS